MQQLKLFEVEKSEPLLPESQLQELRYKFNKMLERRSDMNGSAYGEHHILVSLLFSYHY